MRAIESKYDKSIFGFYQFFRYLVVSSFIVFLVYLYLLLRHILTYEESYTELCAGVFNMNCFLYYSRFESDEGFLYACTLLLFVVLGVGSSLYQWVQFDLSSREKALYEDHKIK